MASTYVNDLRIEEQATGENSGTWGTKVNSAFSQIAEAFSYGTKQLAADANETFTMPDGTTDGTRSLYLKITSAGSLTATRTVTLGPNTVSKLWIIENATTGSQSITIAQGSGGTVTIPTGAVKMVYSDGAGSGAAVVDALVDLDLTGTTKIATANIDGGSIDGTTIGAATAAAGTFTTGQFDTSLNVDGTVTADGLTVDGDVNIADAVPILRLDSPEVTWSGGEDLGGIDWYTEDTSSVGPGVMARIYSESTGSNTLPIPNLIFQTSLADVSLKDRMKIEGNGDISFYEDTGTTAKLFWDASEESLGIGTSSPSFGLSVESDNGSGYAALFRKSSSDPALTIQTTSSITQIQGLNSALTATNDIAMQLSGGNVGIGTSSPDALLSLNASAPDFTFKRSGTTEFRMGVANTTNGGVTGSAAGDTFFRTLNDKMLFSVDNGTTANMMLDSSGNLLVGQTTNSETGTGIGLVSDGTSHMYSGSTDTLMLGRGGTDGEILSFNKSGASVGIVGTSAGHLYVGAGGDTNLLFNDTANSIYPWDSSANDVQDATVDLGASTARFKDLYLSGGAYLGGTAAVNHLDDYEEGTWNPYIVGTTTAGGYSGVVQTGSYTKVGKVVTAAFTFYGTSGTGAGSLNITGFPYAAESSGSGPAVTILQYNSGLSLPSGTYVPILFIQPSTTTAEIRCTNSSSGSSFSLMAYPTTANYVRATITYLTA